MRCRPGWFHLRRSPDAEKYRWAIAILMVVLALAACGSNDTGVKAGIENQHDAILYSDDFSKVPSGWGTRKQAGGMVEYLDGGLHFQVQEPNVDYWSVAGKKFGDVQIEVDAQKRGGPDNNHFGIICRYLNRNNFYLLVISSDQYFGIAKLWNGRYSMIGMEQLQYSDKIRAGKATNHLRADCVGDSLSLRVNGYELVKVQDSDLSNGDVGLIAGTYQENGVNILFDHFLVKLPGD